MSEPGSPPASPASTQQIALPADFPQIPGYRILRRLGQGGMASVYLAMQESLDRPVSIKVMGREALLDEVSKQRFEHEARTIAKLTHPCIVSIYEVGRTAEGQMYYIMPHLPNGDLSQRDLSNNEARIVDVLRSLLSALGYAHARGIVHRDVKEENVLFDAADRPLLTDFGIALSKRDTSRITTAGLAVGSSGYMAPEQARGDEVDGRADLYSVGVLAFELLTGELPFRSSDPLALALMHAQKTIPQLPPTKRHWQSFIDRAMAKSPMLRFRNAQQMQHALDRISRRTGNHIASRVLRQFDQAMNGQLWKRPGVLALGGALLLAIGLYGARDSLPHFSLSSVFASQPKKSEAPVQPAAAAHVDPTTATPAPTMAAAPTAPAPTGAAASAPTTPPAASSSSHVVAQTAIPSAPLTPDNAVMGAARDAIQHANLTAPAGNSAVDLSLMAWKLSPATDGTKQLVADVLKAISAQQAIAIAQHRDPRVVDYQQKAQQLADATIARTTPAWRAFHATAAAALERRVQAESAVSDHAALARTEQLAKQLDLADTYARALASAKAQPAQIAPTTAPVAVATVAPAGFVTLGDPSNAHAAVALARNEVTRHEYAEFINATHRPSAECMGHKFHFFSKLTQHLNWTQPGFYQDDGEPVVCISWEDANAYVQWLNARGGQRYRLPSVADWHTAGTTSSEAKANIASRFSDWLQDCASGCKQHVVSGHSWQDAKSTTQRPGDVGHDDVGIRLVRESGSH